jgi:hypothetical protein
MADESDSPSMNPISKEALVQQLAAAIDPDAPPGLAASELAREVVTLVEDLGGKDAALLVPAVQELVARRKSQEPTEPTTLREELGKRRQRAAEWGPASELDALVTILDERDAEARALIAKLASAIVEEEIALVAEPSVG